MKRIIALLLACVMTVTGCGTSDDNKSSSNDSATESVAEADYPTASEATTGDKESNEAVVTYPDIDSEANLNSEEAEQERAEQDPEDPDPVQHG